MRCGMCHQPFNALETLQETADENVSNNSKSESSEHKISDWIGGLIHHGESEQEDEEESPEEFVDSYNFADEEFIDIREDSAASAAEETEHPVTSTDHHGDEVVEDIRRHVVRVIGDINHIWANTQVGDNLLDRAPIEPEESPVTEVETELENSYQQDLTIRAIDEDVEPESVFVEPKSEASPEVLEEIEALPVEIPTLFATASEEHLMESIKELKTPKNRVKKRHVLAWSVAYLFLLLMLATQIVYIYRNHFVRSQMLRPVLEMACEITRCTLRPRRDVEQIAIIDRQVMPDAKRADVLIIEAVMENQAAFRQPAPLVEFKLQDLTGATIGYRQFQPSEYLPSNVSGTVWMEPEKPLRVRLEILGAPKDAAQFQFRFL